MAQLQKILWFIPFFWLTMVVPPVNSADALHNESIHCMPCSLLEYSKSWIASEDIFQHKRDPDALVYSTQDVALKNYFIAYLQKNDSGEREDREEKAFLRPHGSKPESSLLGMLRNVRPRPEIRYMNGHSTYHISFDNTWADGGHGESELEWPINNWFVGINFFAWRKVALRNPHQTKSQFGVRLLFKINKDAGTMKDSDWIENDTADANIGTLHPGKDLYGELDAKLGEGIIIDLNYVYNFPIHERISIGPIVGYAYKKLQWSGRNLIQRNNGPWVIYDYTDTNGWEWIRYEVTYGIPYFGVNSEFLFGKSEQFRLNLNFGYSAWVRVSDRDSHLYPDWDAANPGFDYNMISNGDHEGNAYIVKMDGGWILLPNWTLFLGGEYVNIDTEGYIQQGHYINGSLVGISSAIQDVVTSSSWSVLFQLHYAF